MPYPIHPVAQPYAWGGYEFLPRFLGREPSQEPMAELWFGDHPKGPAPINGADLTLADLIADHPARHLGNDVVQRFGPRMPFLLKVLDVRQMLSIQVHPDKGTAEAGFAREEANGPERTAPNRNFRDDNHKPELGVAVTDFYLLHGFRSVEDVRATLSSAPGWDSLTDALETEGLAGLYEHVMRADQGTVDRLLQPLVDKIKTGTYRRTQPEFWAQRAVEQYSHNGHHDRGIFSIFWFNLVHLRPGQAIFQDAGIPHAYLEGQCIELMANSDNVLRGGLTPKHIDVDELLLNVRFEAVFPNILEAKEQLNGLWEYQTPAPDFGLRYAQLTPGADFNYTAQGPAVALIWEGSALLQKTVLNDEQRAVFVASGEEIRLQSAEGALVYFAGVGE